MTTQAAHLFTETVALVKQNKGGHQHKEYPKDCTKSPKLFLTLSGLNTKAGQMVTILIVITLVAAVRRAFKKK